MTVAWSYSVLLAGRAVAGFAVGLTLVLAPLYAAEVSPARLRGMLTSLIEAFLNIGIVLGYTASWALQDWPGAKSWRAMLGLAVLPSFLVLLGACFAMSESPRWLAAQGRIDEAVGVLRRIVGPEEAACTAEQLQRNHAPAGAKVGNNLFLSVDGALAPSPAEVDAEDRMGVEEGEQQMSWKEMLCAQETRWLVFLGSSVAFFSQATGIESVVYYSNIILLRAGVEEGDMLKATMLVGCAKLAAILTGGAVVDRLGRKPLLLLSSLGLCLSMLLLSLAFRINGTAPAVAPDGHSTAGGGEPIAEGMALFAMVAFVVSFSLGYGPLTFVLNAELYPQRCRSKGMSLAIGVTRVTSATVTLTFLSLASLFTEAGAFLCFSLVALASLAFVLLLLPETRGASLEDAAAVASSPKASKGPARHRPVCQSDPSDSQSGVSRRQRAAIQLASQTSRLDLQCQEDPELTPPPG
uniref:Hexose transporter 1 n=1 Tax=Pyrodinium bahamense TaxID=73915 RepID=A0A7S0B6E1_9DINO